MNIQQYRESKDMSRQELAEVIGCTAEYVRLVEKGERRPSVDMAKKIESLTDGEVTRAKVRPDIWGDA